MARSIKNDLQLLNLVTRPEMNKAGVTAVLSGGAAVSIYSENRYQSSDLDFVTSERIVDLVATLSPLGFIKGSDRHLSHPDSDYYVEFPPGPVAIGSTVITEWNQLEAFRRAYRKAEPAATNLFRPLL